MLNEPFIYIILLNWNGGAKTVQCLSSLSKITYQNYKIIVVDNASTDDSLEIIKKKFPEQHVILSDKNWGFGGGNNIGIRHALQSEADYIWILNNDTTTDANSLSAMVDVAEKNPQIGAVGSLIYDQSKPNTLLDYGGGNVRFFLGLPCRGKKFADKALAFVSGASCLLKVKALRDVEGFDETFFMYWEDVDLSFRLRQKGWLLSVAKDAKIFHEETSSLGRRSPLIDKYFTTTTVQFFRKHYRLWWWPVVVSVGLRCASRLLRGEWGRIQAIFHGLRAAFR